MTIYDTRCLHDHRTGCVGSKLFSLHLKELPSSRVLLLRLFNIFFSDLWKSWETIIRTQGRDWYSLHILRVCRRQPFQTERSREGFTEGVPSGWALNPCGLCTCRMKDKEGLPSIPHTGTNCAIFSWLRMTSNCWPCL